VILPASYANGFAPRDGQPLYPSLWRGCVGAWNPGLGPTGLTLRDWSGLGRHGPLSGFTAASDWVLNRGKYCLNFDGTNNQIDTGITLAGYTQATIAFWGFRANGLSRLTVGERSGSAGANGLILDCFTDGTLYAVAANGSVTYGSMFVTAFTGWHHYLLQYDGRQASNATRLRLWINNIERSLSYTGTIPSSIGATSRTFKIGEWETGFSTCLLDDLWLFNKPASTNASLLSSRRGIAYELAPRRRSSTAVQFNRRRRLLLGST
jgi:hypothetical protein